MIALKLPPSAALPRLSEWSPEVDALNRIIDRLGEVLNLLSVTGRLKKPVRPSPAPRPEVAAQRLRRRRRAADHSALVARVLPPQP